MHGVELAASERRKGRIALSLPSEHEWERRIAVFGRDMCCESGSGKLEDEGSVQYIAKARTREGEPQALTVLFAADFQPCPCISFPLMLHPPIPSSSLAFRDYFRYAGRSATLMGGSRMVHETAYENPSCHSVKRKDSYCYLAPAAHKSLRWWLFGLEWDNSGRLQDGIRRTVTIARDAGRVERFCAGTRS